MKFLCVISAWRNLDLTGTDLISMVGREGVPGEVEAAAHPPHQHGGRGAEGL